MLRLELQILQDVFLHSFRNRNDTAIKVWSGVI